MHCELFISMHAGVQRRHRELCTHGAGGRVSAHAQQQMALESRWGAVSWGAARRPVEAVWARAQLPGGWRVASVRVCHVSGNAHRFPRYDGQFMPRYELECGQDDPPSRWVVEDPNNVSNNLAGGSFNIFKVGVRTCVMVQLVTRRI